MARYVITKWSRSPGSISYSGPAWDGLGIRHLYKETYVHKEEAKALADLLATYNPVGFEVYEISD